MLWEEARRQLVRQEAGLDTLRTQAVAVLSVASIVAGLFGAHVMTAHRSSSEHLWIGIALALFAGTVIAALVILWPRKWAFDHSLAKRVQAVESQEVVRAFDLAFSWAKGFEAGRKRNQSTVDCLMVVFSVACFLTGAQVIAWGLAVL
jgi:hypothetical protein